MEIFSTLGISVWYKNNLLQFFKTISKLGILAATCYPDLGALRKFKNNCLIQL